jgi:hypothetical protein
MNYFEVLEDTINYYSVDPVNRRSSFNNESFYYKNGNSCAVGRYIIDVKNFIKINEIYNTDPVKSLFESFGFDILKNEVSDLVDIKFWNLIQSLHDTSDYWNDNGLSELGLEKKENIINHIIKLTVK